MHTRLYMRSNFSLFKALVIALTAVFLLFPAVMLAKEPSAYKQGLEHYARGEFDKAIRQLQKALNQKPDKADKTSIYKYIGLSFYTLGRQGEAQKNFEQCLAHDKSCDIGKNEALDESAIPFFQAIKKQLLSKETQAVVSKTLIRIKSPIKEAEVLLDGILLGPVNTPFDSRPGNLDITVSAKGYEPRNLKIIVKKSVENVYEVNLEKIPPPKPIAKNLPKPDPKEKARSSKPAPADKFADIDGKKDKKIPGTSGSEVIDILDKDYEEPLDQKSARGRKRDPDDGRDREGARDRREKIAKDSDFDRSRESNSRSNFSEDESGGSRARSDSLRNVELIAEPVSVLHFMPFGIGQFYNGDLLAGLVVAGAQAYVISTLVGYNSDIEKAQANELEARRRLQETGEITQAEFENYLIDNDKFIGATREEITLSQGLFAGGYVLGVVHALIMRPHVPVPKNISEASGQSSEAFTYQLRPARKLGLEFELNWKF